VAGKTVDGGDCRARRAPRAHPAGAPSTGVPTLRLAGAGVTPPPLSEGEAPRRLGPADRRLRASSLPEARKSGRRLSSAAIASPRAASRASSPPTHRAGGQTDRCVRRPTDEHAPTFTRRTDGRAAGKINGRMDRVEVQRQPSARRPTGTCTDERKRWIDRQAPVPGLHGRRIVQQLLRRAVGQPRRLGGHLAAPHSVRQPLLHARSVGGGLEGHSCARRRLQTEAPGHWRSAPQGAALRKGGSPADCTDGCSA
jgi:hypothetical protein